MVNSIDGGVFEGLISSPLKDQVWGATNCFFANPWFPQMGISWELCVLFIDIHPYGLGNALVTNGTCYVLGDEKDCHLHFVAIMVLF